MAGAVAPVGPVQVAGEPVVGAVRLGGARRRRRAVRAGPVVRARAGASVPEGVK